MWQPLWKILEFIGRMRLPLGRSTRLRVGDVLAPDVFGDRRWRDYLSSEKLFDVWGPVPGSPWEAFHCATLFAAVDSISRQGLLGPTPPGEAALIDAGTAVKPAERFGRPPAALGWAGPDCMVVVDLPGPQAVALGARFVEAGCQPVCTFDHWPHSAGLLKAELVLAELLRQAPRVAEARQRLHPGSPPVWICDAERLGKGPGRPNQFDNRYYLDESLLPGPQLVIRAGIRRVVCVVPGVLELLVRDIEAYLTELRLRGLGTFGAALTDPELQPQPIRPSRSLRQLGLSGYRRSWAGGFGTLIPEPSSGGS